jgi:hypothetical protein
MRRFGEWFMILTFGSTAFAQAPPACTVEQPMTSLPAEVRETSGLAWGRANRDVLWTHNDSGGSPEIFALDLNGTVRARIPVKGASAVDWEDMDSGPCGNQNCLYVADIGDNAGKRKSVAIYEITEPILPAQEAMVRRVLSANYADGAQDAEAFFRLPSGEMYLVSKGRHRDIALYHLRADQQGGTGTLQRVRSIAPHPEDELDRVTAATASPNGHWVAIRTYRTLQIYRTPELLAGGPPFIRFSLAELGERQGESVALDDQGAVWSTSEAELAGAPTLAKLSCGLRP